MEKESKDSKTGEKEKFAGKTEDEWRDWGADFGKRMDRLGRDFGDELEDWADRFTERMERKGRSWEKRWEHKCERKQRKWRRKWYDTFGVVGPLIESMIGIVILLMCVFFLDAVNNSVGNSFIYALSNFIATYLYVFFGASLFFGYCNYFSRTYPGIRWLIAPVSCAAGIVFALWIAIYILNYAGTYAKSAFLEQVSTFLAQNLWGIFFVVLVLGYVFAVTGKLIFSMWEDL